MRPHHSHSGRRSDGFAWWVALYSTEATVKGLGGEETRSLCQTVQVEQEGVFEQALHQVRDEKSQPVEESCHVSFPSVVCLLSALLVL